MHRTWIAVIAARLGCELNGADRDLLQVIELSSAENELCDISVDSCTGLGLQSLLQDWGAKLQRCRSHEIHQLQDDASQEDDQET